MIVPEHCADRQLGTMWQKKWWMTGNHQRTIPAKGNCWASTAIPAELTGGPIDDAA